MEISSEFQEYLTQNFNLALSLIIKSNAVALAINDWVVANTGAIIDNYDPYTWKYYINLSGNYSPYDQPIYIYSLDTGEKILLSVENLANNPVTKENYYPGSFFYNQLINQYPLQQDLILSILYPVPIDEAINAKDGTILNYNSNYVEEQEYTLMRDLQDWIYGQYVRWNIDDYSISDSLYVPAFRAVLYNNIIPKLLNLRLLRCKTIEVHSFHLKQYLNSNNNIGKYSNYLTREEQLYLYRNLPYLRRRSGFKKVFTDLIENLAIPSSVNISAFYMYTTNTFNGYVSINDFYTKSLTGAQGLLNNQFTLNDVLNLESPLLKNNPYYISKEYNKIYDLTQYTLENEYDTKMLYVDNINYPHPFDFRFHEIIFNELMYLAFTENYKAISIFTLKNSFYYLSALDAVYLLVYIANIYNGIEIENLPTLRPVRVLRRTPPTYEEIQSLLIENDYAFIDLESLYNDIVSMFPSDYNMYNIISFYNYCEQIYQTLRKTYYYTTTFNNPNNRAFFENFIRCFFSDYVLPVKEVQSYSEWLAEKSIDLSNYSRNELLSLYTQLLKSITNYDLSEISEYEETIKAIVKIMEALISYTLQFILNISLVNRSLDFKQIREYNFETELINQFYIPIPNIYGITIPHFYDRMTSIFNNNIQYNLNMTISLNSPSNNLNMLSSEELSNIVSVLSS